MLGWITAWRQKSAVVTNPLDLYRVMLEDAGARAGVTVNHETALQCSVAYACARVIAEGMSSIPFKLKQRVDRKRQDAEDDPVYELLTLAPNDNQTVVEFFDQVGLHLAFAGNAYIWKLKDTRGRVMELLPWMPNRVRADFTGDAPKYEFILQDGRRVELGADDVWHIRGPSWDGWQGLDGVKLAREAIGMAMAAEQHGSQQFANGGRLAGFLTTDQKLTPEQRKDMRENWKKQQLSNPGGVGVLSHAMKFIAMSGQNDHAQWNEARTFQIAEVCRHARVMPIMVGYSDKAATYASAAAMFDAHIRYTMLPWYRRIEISANKWLLTKDQRGEGKYFKFVPDALLRGNSKDRAAFYTSLFNMGAMSPNEIRALEDMNPYDGGDEYRLPLNTEDASGKDDDDDDDDPEVVVDDDED